MVCPIDILAKARSNLHFLPTSCYFLRISISLKSISKEIKFPLLSDYLNDTQTPQQKLKLLQLSFCKKFIETNKLLPECFLIKEKLLSNSLVEWDKIYILQWCALIFDKFNY